MSTLPSMRLPGRGGGRNFVAGMDGVDILLEQAAAGAALRRLLAGGRGCAQVVILVKRK